MLSTALTRYAFFSHWSRVRGLFAACAFIIYLSGASALAQTYFSGTPKIIDPGIDAAKVGQHASMAIVDGRPAISYYDETSGDLKFIHAIDPQGTMWGTPVTVDDGGVNGNVGQYTSLAEVDGRPAIAYHEVTGFVPGANLKYALSKTEEGAQGDWTILVRIPVTAGNLGQYASLKVIDNHPAISFYDDSANVLKYLRATSPTGNTPADWALAPVTVDTGTGATPNVGQYTSLEVVNGKPAISYYDVTNTNLKYARARNSTGMPDGSPAPLWNTFTVDNVGANGQYTSLEVVNNLPSITYYRAGGNPLPNNDLRYARANGIDGETGWSATTVVDSVGNVGQYTSLTVVDGRPAVSYYEPENNNLKYARSNDPTGIGSGWTSVTLDSLTTVGILGQYTSIVIVDQNPAVAYWDGTNFDLKFVRAANTTGIDPNPNIVPWGARQTLDRGGGGHVGQHTSMAIVDGNPAVSYYNPSEQTLRYIRANDPEGTTWAKPVTIAIGIGAYPTVGVHISLAFVDGRPAIAYYDAATTDLKYIRATNSTGIDPNPNNPPPWGPPVTVDTTVGNIGQFCSLKVVDGKPAISYYDATPGALDLRYIRANNSTGIPIPPPPSGMPTWGPSVLVDDAGTVGLHTSLEVVDNKPAISYYLSTGGSDLKYAQSSSPTGTNAGDWTKQAVDTIGNVGQYTSLEVIGGKPAIGYYDLTNTNLKYIGGNALANPQTWATSITVNGATPAASVGQYSSLAEVNGKPAISYYSGTGNTLRYVRATVANPTVAAQWGTFLTLDGTTGTSAPLVGQYTSMAVVACNPAISYYDATSFDLKFIRSKTLWSGAVSNDWSNPANWAFGCVPYAGETVELPPGAGVVTNEVVIDKNVSVGDFTMGTTRTLSVTGGAIFTVNSVLTLNGGRIVVDPGSLIVFGCNATVVGGSATAFIAGDVRKEFCAPGGFVFKVGELTGTAEYSPLTVNVTAGTFPPAVSTPPSLTVHVTDAPLPGLVAATAVSRYWTVTEAGSLTADMTFEYVPADVNSSTGYNAYRSSGLYAFQVPSTHTGNTVSVSGITNFSNWGIGAEAVPPPLVILGGQVTDMNGKYVYWAEITLTEENGTKHTAHTNGLGYYLIPGIAVGQTVKVNITHKSYTTFTPPMYMHEVTQKFDDLNFVASP